MKEQLVLKILELLLNSDSNDVKMIDNSAESKSHMMVGEYCVVRTYSAGVHVGEVTSVNGTEVILSNSRRIWKWSDAFTLSELSQNGVGNNSKIAVPVPTLVLTEAIEIIPCSTRAAEKIKGFSTYEV